jgi:hypothetical protein
MAESYHALDLKQNEAETLAVLRYNGYQYQD